MWDGAATFYGTTLQGGAKGLGTIFKIIGNVETLLYSFTGAVGDGNTPTAGLYYDSVAKVLYGTTYLGGNGNGNFFKFDPAALKYTNLHSFAQADGIRPHGEVIRDAAGNFYGTAAEGGDAAGDGSLWEYSAAGAFKVLHTFNGADGSVPSAALLLDPHGNLLGTTAGGGANAGCSFNQVNGCGTVFSFNLATSQLTTLHSFAGVDGMFPPAPCLRMPPGL